MYIIKSLMRCLIIVSILLTPFIDLSEYSSEFVHSNKNRSSFFAKKCSIQHTYYIVAGNYFMYDNFTV